MRFAQGFVKNAGGSYSVGMPPNGEKIVRISAKDSGQPEASETFAIESELDQLPDTPEKIAAMLRTNLAEINTREISGKGILSEEAEFVSRLESALGDFYRAHPDISLERRPSLSYFVSILDGSLKNIALPPEEVRALMLHIKERFGVPERGDLTILEDDRAVKGQAGRIEAHRQLIEGITEAWKQIFKESWRQYNAEQFPVRVRGEVEDIVTTDSYQHQQALINGLIDRVSRGTPERFRKFMKALIEQSVGMKTEVVNTAELRAFADYIAPRLPIERGMTADEIYEHMRAASPNKGAVQIPREVLSLVITAFARDIRAVHELADPTRLFEGEMGTKNHIFNTVRSQWEVFSNPQRAQFIELVQANLVAVSPKGDEGALKREGKGKRLRNELSDQCKKIARSMRDPEAKISDADIKLLAKLIELRTEEVMDYRTRPVAEQEAVETKEQQDMTPKQLFAEVAERLSKPNVLASAILRMLMRPDMADARKVVYAALLQTVIPSLDERDWVRKIQNVRGITLDKLDKDHIQTVIDSGGERGKDGWEILLLTANASHKFRELMKERAGALK